MHKKLIPIAEHLICAVETQMEDLENVCTKELGEVIDMIKDLSKAIYYDVVTEAMLDKEELGEDFIRFRTILSSAARGFHQRYVTARKPVKPRARWPG